MTQSLGSRNFTYGGATLPAETARLFMLSARLSGCLGIPTARSLALISAASAGLAWINLIGTRLILFTPTSLRMAKLSRNLRLATRAWTDQSRGIWLNMHLVTSPKLGLVLPAPGREFSSISTTKRTSSAAIDAQPSDLRRSKCIFAKIRVYTYQCSGVRGKDALLVLSSGSELGMVGSFYLAEEP